MPPGLAAGTFDGQAGRHIEQKVTMMERRIELSLPAYLAGAWGIRERPVKGPKRGLSLGRIVDTAVSVADAEGLSAVSMSRVASELGASTMSLYRYVSSKDGLLLLMVDALYENPPFRAVARRRLA